MIFITLLLTIILISLTTFYIWIKYQFSYWQRKNVPSIPPKLFAGNINDIIMFRDNAAECFVKLYYDPATETEPIVGIHVFHQPALLIKDLEIIKRILVKDFNKFANRYSKPDIHSDKLAAYNLFFIRTPVWKQMRSNLTPTFTSGKIKQMFPLIDEIGEQFNAYLSSLEFDSNTKSICKDVKELCALYATDVIASVAFAVQSNSLKNPDGEFRKGGKSIFKFTAYRAIEFLSIFFIPQIVSFFKFKAFSTEGTKFLRETLAHVIKEREKSNIQRNDLIDSMLTLKSENMKSTDKNVIKYEDDVLVAIAALFFTAGFETTSTTMAFTLYELAKNSDIQYKLRAEIKEVLENNDGKLTYDLIYNMEYLRCIVDEVLRLYPPMPFIDRECSLSKDEKGYSLEPYSKYEIPHGMPIYIPIYAIHRDERYFPNPDIFDPDRFSAENKMHIPPYAYMPFGIGQRNCIGDRFGLMQVKIGLVHFLKNHFVRTVPNKDVTFEKKAFILVPKDGIQLNITRDCLI